MLSESCRLCEKLEPQRPRRSQRTRTTVCAPHTGYQSYGIIRLTLGVSASLTSTVWPSLLLRFLSFEVRMWRKCEWRRFTLPVALPFVIRKEEILVVPDGASERGAELILM